MFQKKMEYYSLKNPIKIPKICAKEQKSQEIWLRWKSSGTDKNLQLYVNHYI